MAKFKHAIWLSLKYKWTILGSVLASLGIALLWGASITTVFPVVKIVLEGETAQIWVAKEIQDAESEQRQFDEQIAELQAQQNLANVQSERDELQKQIDLKSSRREAEARALQRD